MIASNWRMCALLIVTASALAGASAQPGIVVRVQPASIEAGQTTAVLLTAPVGASVLVRTDAPGVPPQTVVVTASQQRISLGPFVSTGNYQVIGSSAGQNSTAMLRVAFPRDTAAPAPAVESGTSYEAAADALIDAVDRARTGVLRLPQGEPTIGETKAALDDLQRQLVDVRRAATAADDVFDAVGRQLEKDADASREAKDEFTRLEREINQNLAEQARQGRDLGRDAEQPAVDSCVAAMAVSAALQASQSTLNAMRTGLADLQGGQSRREAGASPPRAAEWQQIKAKIEDLVRTGQAGSYAEAQRSIGRATGTGGLDGYTARQCDKFSGEWSGTTYVEALEKGQPYYGLQNDWHARVEIAVTRAVEGSPGADRPLRGTVSGRGANFKVVNQLRTLYAGRPAQHIEFLTTEPSSAQQQSATFVGVVEGFVRGNQMTLKLRSGGVDYAGRVTGKIAAVVIPMASPVPLVQVYDVAFQGGNWQLGRAVGPSGMPDRPFAIVTGGNKRIVQEEYPRTLATAGARGRFTIQIRLCSGCD